jgi:hypothetical protein
MDLPGGIEETHENLLIRVVDIPVKIRCGYLPNTNPHTEHLQKKSYKKLSL